MTQFNIVEFVGQQEQLFLPKIVDSSVDWASESQFAIQLFQANDYLAKVAMSNPISAQNAIINVAAIGISLNPAQKLAYLVPRNGGVCLDISYMGLLHLAMDSGSIKLGQSVIVYANDTFKTRGIDKDPLHEFEAFGDRGDPVGCYCVVKTADGDYLTEIMSKADIYAIRDQSQAWKGHLKSGKACPWSTNELEMWRKTVVKRGSKYWPKVERLNNATAYLNDNGEGFDKEPVMPHYSQAEVDALKAQANSDLIKKIDQLCVSMNMAGDENELKTHFSMAYTITKDTPQQKEVMAVYARNKERF